MSVTLTISDGSQRTVAVTWGEVNTSTTGTKTTTATYTLPSGISGTPPIVTMQVIVTAAPLTVVGVVQPAGVTVVQNGTPSLPSTITLNISDGSTRVVAVSWSSYNTANLGEQTLTGTYTMPSGIGGTPPPVSLVLTVVAPQTLTILSVVQPAGVSVVQGGTPVLPTTVVLNISDGTTRTVNVTWSDYDTSVVGQQTLTGSYSLPSGVTGGMPPVTIILTVTAVSNIVDKMDFIGSIPGARTGTDSYGDYVEFDRSALNNVSLMDSLEWNGQNQFQCRCYIAWRTINATQKMSLFADRGIGSSEFGYVAADAKMDYDYFVYSNRQPGAQFSFHFLAFYFYSNNSNAGIVRIYNYAVAKGTEQPSWFGSDEQ